MDGCEMLTCARTFWNNTGIGTVNAQRKAAIWRMVEAGSSKHEGAEQADGQHEAVRGVHRRCDIRVTMMWCAIDAKSSVAM